MIMTRGRPRGFDRRKIATIVTVLANNPDGIWLRRVADEAKLSPATVGFYADSVLAPLLEDSRLGKEGKPILRVLRLKPYVLERIQEGKSIDQVLKILGLMSKIG